MLCEDGSGDRPKAIGWLGKIVNNEEFKLKVVASPLFFDKTSFIYLDKQISFYK
jgi:hypothetical protein